MKRFLYAVVVASALTLTFYSCKSNAEITPDAAIPSTNRSTAPGTSTSTTATIYSPWITLNNWAGLTNSAGYVYYTNTLTSLGQVNQQVLDQSVLLVYARIDGPTGPVQQFPFRRAWDRIPGRLFYENWSYIARVGQLQFYIDPEVGGYTAPAGAQVRYVIIPGDTPAGGRKGNIDYSDYNAVKEAYNLPD